MKKPKKITLGLLFFICHFLSVNGQALRFPSPFNTESYVMVSDVAPDTASTEISVSFWIYKPLKFTRARYWLSYAIVEEFNHMIIGVNEHDNLAFYVKGGHTQSRTALELSTWHHVAMTWRSIDGLVYIYVNGVQVHSGTTSAGATIKGGGTLVLGQEQDAVGGSFDLNQAFSGSLDQLFILSKILTESEVTEIHEAGRTRLSDQISGGDMLVSWSEILSQPLHGDVSLEIAGKTIAGYCTLNLLKIYADHVI
ncbi:hypothetical protein ACHWQZ_G018932 [Mnemiopsis leidyi]